MMSVSVPGSRKIVIGQPQLSRLWETLAELPLTGDQVGLFKPQPGRPKGEAQHAVCPKSSMPFRLAILETTVCAVQVPRSDKFTRSACRVGGYAVSVKAEPVEEHNESGIILDLTRCGQRLNNRAAI